ncbi:MAG: hypothetical protein ACTSO9_19615, partial [Candidatus Helarchaeota archaeon]
MTSLCAADPLLYLWNSLILLIQNQVNTIQVLLFPMLIAYTLLVIHGIYFEGKKFALAFFGGFLVYGIIREFIVRNTASPYSFGNLAPIFQIINLPIAIGWSFACYLSYWFAKWIVELITDNTNTPGKKFRISIVASMFVWFITFAIEYTGSRMGWWHYNPAIPPGHLQIFGVYLFLFGGWGITMFAFLLPFQLNYYADEIGIAKKERILSLFLIPSLYAGITIGNYLILYDAMITYIVFLLQGIPLGIFLAIKL